MLGGTERGQICNDLMVVEVILSVSVSVPTSKISSTD